MKRRNFIGMLGATGGLLASAPLVASPAVIPVDAARQKKRKADREMKADLIIAGGGIGGCACALGALRNGLSVVMTEETDWIGGQITQQGVPLDEHRWIETHGATQLYREFRSALRQYYKRNYPLTDDAAARENLNPGDGAVSRLCVEPKVALAVLNAMFAPYISSGQLTLLLEHKATRADIDGNQVRGLEVENRQNGKLLVLTAPYFVDATEMGDLLPLTGTEYVTGTESKKETGELHAPEVGDPENEQAFTLCFALDYRPGENHVIDKPENYDFWRSYVPNLTPAWPGRLLDLTYSTPSTLKPKTLGFHPEGGRTGNVMNLWNYRKIINRHNFKPGFYAGDMTVVNWPQNDYLLGRLVDVSEKAFQKHVEGARQLNLSLVYWLQTEVERPDGGAGWSGIRLRKDVMGTEDGMAKYPYIREGRRIKSLFTVLEEHVGVENRTLVKGKEAAATCESFYDSVGVGSYYLDLHPSTKGDNYIDLPSLPFEVPLGALIPQRMENLLPASKNIGTTHITNGCYRLHPVEWNIGEVVGMLVQFASKKHVTPRDVRENKDLLADFQRFVHLQGVETKWPQ
ncbi:FAD-dependent oxidoreductase [Sunxiuqinia elliptica]|uniref:Tat (Twin-arginine translocation) pathway signal sequence n=1 Tax=Sunxiuqinia elliptica TaxID=655355 RepID=A0A1I2D1X5_9BACT|nr:FAD-dependent oxidoreductase [Sunxiuqinia elliptica]SFE74516.1 Tat (twin-arginine translocation) pathway signal sequence [Sunxiuqinia elliptica]